MPKKYGVENISQVKEIKEKKEKTFLRHFGTKNNYGRSSVVNNIFKRRKFNNTLNTSKSEEELYLYIKEKFPSVIRQYKDKERYPFCCDFYIPELDLFLELNGMWTHGEHAYNKEKDKNKLIQWEEKSKNSNFYKCAIKVWTIKDPEKRDCAKNNHLNFKEVWSLQEGKEFIDNLYEKREIP